MKSDITKKSMAWAERCQKMREDLEAGAYDWLFFKVIINRLDASRMHDYERYTILDQMETAIWNGYLDILQPLLEELEAL